jgi:hypothetical protein
MCHYYNAIHRLEGQGTGGQLLCVRVSATGECLAATKVRCYHIHHVMGIL